MRHLLVLSIALAALGTACYDAVPPPIAPDPPSENPLVVAPSQDENPETPKVVRRLVGEARAQMTKNRAMIVELPDARGRERASAEAREIEDELDALTGRIEDANSDNLDEVMSRLQLLDTRIDLMHDRLRAATLRSTAVAKE
ncbi:MAG: hypothetical protein KIT84_32610 [Labilithrix sp.]|nr:hypothetical protein [Labilithrix sp.]MCW5815817.1 hypothetical protein [Labilithrix sp.]